MKWTSAHWHRYTGFRCSYGLFSIFSFNNNSFCIVLTQIWTTSLISCSLLYYQASWQQVERSRQGWRLPLPSDFCKPGTWIMADTIFFFSFYLTNKTMTQTHICLHNPGQNLKELCQFMCLLPQPKGGRTVSDYLLEYLVYSLIFTI